MRVEVGEPDVVARVVAALQAGQVVVLPTDTVYGLAALPTDASAIEQLFALKGRAADTPLAVLCASAEQALELAAAPDAVRAAAQRWWPGPLTLVVTRRAGVGLHLGEPPDTIGLRVPDHDLVLAVAAAVGPIAATSANRHGEPSAVTAAHAEAALGAEGLGLVVDGGTLAPTASTVVDATGPIWNILREGPIRGADVIDASE